VIFQYPRCWIVSSDLRSAWLRFAHRKSFSILAVGSFPQTPGAHGNQARDRSLSVSSLLDRFLRPPPRARRDRSQSTLSVSSLLDRFLRLVAAADKRLSVALSVSSLLDRFLRRRFAPPPSRPFLLSVSSLLDRFLRRHITYLVMSANSHFQYPRCWIVSSDYRIVLLGLYHAWLSVSSLLDRFLRRVAAISSVAP